MKLKLRKRGTNNFITVTDGLKPFRGARDPVFIVRHHKVFKGAELDGIEERVSVEQFSQWWTEMRKAEWRIVKDEL